MALLRPFLSDASLFKTLQLSHPKLMSTRTRSAISLSQNSLRKIHYQSLKKQWVQHAVAEVSGGGVSFDDDGSVFVSPSGDARGERVVVDYDWTEEWDTLYLIHNIPDDAPLGLTVFDKQVVLYRDGGGELRCYEDRCPHRLAKLSEGQLIDGRLECLYHGWQFEGQGECVRIPQLPADARIPKSACVKTYEVRDSQGVA
ncbi:hypothetical protein RJ639_028356 [Escallonia herrerae]|uniref:Rieske domain-containing protein n=1 Tax=Escallonia herrerae TaxID=1293975 RepID=A0AA88XJG4_9ASTE|nr:hypothetical protein RJ639_028356 [Escallonia herrerae]